MINESLRQKALLCRTVVHFIRVRMTQRISNAQSGLPFFKITLKFGLLSLVRRWTVRVWHIKEKKMSEPNENCFLLSSIYTYRNTEIAPVCIGPLGVIPQWRRPVSTAYYRHWRNAGTSIWTWIKTSLKGMALLRFSMYVENSIGTQSDEVYAETLRDYLIKRPIIFPLCSKKCSLTFDFPLTSCNLRSSFKTASHICSCYSYGHFHLVML